MHDALGDGAGTGARPRTSAGTAAGVRTGSGARAETGRRLHRLRRMCQLRRVRHVSRGRWRRRNREFGLPGSSVRGDRRVRAREIGTRGVGTRGIGMRKIRHRQSRQPWVRPNRKRHRDVRHRSRSRHQGHRHRPRHQPRHRSQWRGRCRSGCRGRRRGLRRERRLLGRCRWGVVTGMPLVQAVGAPPQQFAAAIDTLVLPQQVGAAAGGAGRGRGTAQPCAEVHEWDLVMVLRLHLIGAVVARIRRAAVCRSAAARSGRLIRLVAREADNTSAMGWRPSHEE